MNLISCEYMCDVRNQIIIHETDILIFSFSFLPPGSYINAQAFDMQKLGALLHYLIKNPDMYEFFFDWMKYYYYQVRPRSQVCDLCSKLNHHNGTPIVKSNFRRWWDPEYRDVCQRKRLYKLFNAQKMPENLL